MKNVSAIVILLIMLCSSKTYATDPDFFIDFGSCKTTIGYFILSEDSIKTIDGTPTTLACFRRGEDVACTFRLKGGSEGIKGNTVNYKVRIDSPPFLCLETENGSEFITINTVKHAAVLSIRVMTEDYFGSKICQGLYATGSELKSLNK